MSALKRAKESMLFCSTLLAKLSSHQNAYIIFNVNNTVSLEIQLQYSIFQRISTVSYFSASLKYIRQKPLVVPNAFLP